MKFRVDRASFFAAVSAASRATAKQNASAMTGHVRLSARDGQMLAESMDGILYCRASAAAEVEVEGEVCVSAAQLTRLPQQLPEGTILIEETDCNRLRLVCGSVACIMSSIPSRDFQAGPRFDGEGKEFELAPLRSAIDRVIVAVSADQTKAALVWGLFENGLIVATDGHRLHAIACEHPLVVGSRVPRAALVEWGKMHGETARLYQVDDHVAVESGGMMFAAKTGSISFPPWRQAVPKKFTKAVAISRESMLRACSRAAKFANTKTKTCVLEFTADRCRITAKTDDGIDEINESIPCELEGSDLKIGTNAEYLRDAVSATQSDSLRIEMQGELDPMIFIDGESKLLVMPMRI